MFCGGLTLARILSTRPLFWLLQVNLSIFRSAVDSWAIQQVFPICPIHRLHEEPTVAATLADLTCDSDGKIDRFINPKVGRGGWFGRGCVQAPAILGPLPAAA